MMTYFSLEPPTKWQAGISAPNTPNEEVFYFDCADCGAKEPEIAGILGTGPSFREIGVLKVEGSAFFNPAMFCAECFNKRIEAAKESERQEQLDQFAGDLSAMTGEDWTPDQAQTVNELAGA